MVASPRFGPVRAPSGPRPGPGRLDMGQAGARRPLGARGGRGRG